MKTAKPIISFRDVTIRFGSLCANDRVTLDVIQGEIMALLGENGAGKTTLMKILSGLYSRNEGEVIIKGKSMPHKYSPNEAISLGISMVPQHSMLVEAFTVAENIVLGEERAVGKIVFDKRKACKQVETLCKKFGIDVSPSEKTEKLALGVKQKIEILKALYRNTEILILDEPTAVLTPQEVDELLELLRTLRNKGMTIIIITHKLREAVEISDRVIVMRQGKNVATFQTKQTDVDELSHAMVGRNLKSDPFGEREPIVNTEEPYLSFHDVCTDSDQERSCLKNISLDLFSGQILGVAGIDGNGQRELVEVLAGVRSIKQGFLKVENESVKNNSSSIMRALGIGIIPEDRTKLGLVLDLPIKDNIMIGYRHDPQYIRHGIFKHAEATKFVKELISKYDIRPPAIGARCRYVSGGNQQKVVLARELERKGLKIVVASQISRGLDIGATDFAHSALLKLRNSGKAILLISSDLDEIMKLSDRIAVIRDGKIIECKDASCIDRHEIGLCMGHSETKEVIDNETYCS